MWRKSLVWNLNCSNENKSSSIALLTCIRNKKQLHKHSALPSLLLLSVYRCDLSLSWTEDSSSLYVILTISDLEAIFHSRHRNFKHRRVPLGYITLSRENIHQLITGLSRLYPIIKNNVLNSTFFHDNYISLDISFRK